MADVSTAVRRLQIETTVTGASDAATQLGRLNASYQANASASAAAEKAGDKYETQLAAMQRQCDALARAQMAQNAAMAANAAALSNASNSMVAANDNTAKSFTIAGIEMASMVNHLKLAGEAAYAFSPAFRGVVNGLAAPALRGATVALAAVAGGIVTGTNLAGSGLVRLGAAAASVGPSFAPLAAGITSAGVAMQAFSPSLSGAAASILSRLAPALSFVLGPLLLVYHAVNLATEAWRLGGEELDRYRKVAEDAAKVDLSTTYFQKLTKGAADAKVPVDALTTAFANLQKQSADQLGGSVLQNRLDASVKAGNFSGNTGVQAYAQANTTQQRYEAIVSLIHQAMESGQRLAALDIAGTAFGPEAADNLRKDSEYFDKLNAAAAKVADTQIVSPEDVGRALDLQRRYDDAVKILETRWHPVQDLLTQAGIEFHANWVATVETIALGVDWATKLVMKLGDVPAWFQKKLNEGGQWIIDNTTTPESRASAEKDKGISSDPTEMAKGTDAYAIAVNKLRAGLQDQAEQQRKVSEANTIAQKTLGYTSHTIDNAATSTQKQTDAYTRALESVTKHTARMQADTLAVGLGAGAQEEYRARTQLTLAAQLAGRAPTAALTAEIEKQAKAAGAAGQALALAKAQSQANFSTQTLFMSSGDLAAAGVMHNLYGDEWQSHMDDALAKQIKMNSLLSEVKGTIEQSAASFANDFVSGIMSGKSAMESLSNAAVSLGKSLTTAGINNIIKDPTSITGYVEAGVGLLAQAFGGQSDSQKQLEAAQAEWKKAGPAFQKFLTEMSGGVQGDIAATFQQNFQTAYGLAVQADKAGDRAAVTRIYEAEGRNAIDQSKKFLSTFDAALQGMTDGLGSNSPFLAAVNNVKDQLATVQKFVDDARVAAGAVVGGVDLTTGETLAGANAGQLSAIADATGRATTAAETYLVSLLQAAPALSTVQTALLNVNGTAAALQTSLVQLGMSSESAAAEIKNGVGKALDAIKAQFEESLTERLNTANGAGYLNDASALVKQHSQDIADASALGLSQAQVAAVFHAEAQKIVDDAGLVGDSFNDFITLFPDFNGVVNQSATALAAATQKVQAFVKSLNDYLNGLQTGTNSTLSPAAQLSAAQKNFSDQFALAQAGNEDALGTITQYASTLLDQAKGFFASSSGYTDIYNQVTNALKTLPAALGATDGSDKIVTAITTTAAQSDTLQAAQNALAQQQASYLLVQTQLLGAINGLSDRTVAATNGVGSLMASIATGHSEQFRQMVSLLQQQLNQAASGGGGSVWSWLGFQNGGVIPGYATGGVVGNGCYGVDSVVARYAGGGQINLAGGEYVMPADQTRQFRPVLDAMRSGSLANDNRAPSSFDWQGLARAIKQISDMSDERSASKSDELADVLNMLPTKLASEIRRAMAGTKPRAA